MSSTAPTGHTRVAAVIGQPVRHSLSPVIHNAAFQALGLDWVYVAFEVEPEALPGAVAGFRALGVAGMNVTMPHKSDIVALLDDVTPVAADLGAVNTVFRRGGRVVGDSTDGEGFLDALRLDEGFDPAGRRCLVAGAGGAARAVVHALAGAGAASVVVVNRTADRAEAAAALAGGVGRAGPPEEVADADLVVNATPVGMRHVVATIDGSPLLPVDPDRLAPGQLVVDLVYDPPVTPLVDAARERGVAAANGLGMLIHQAAHAFRRWVGDDPPLAVMSAAAMAEMAGRTA